MGKDLLKPLIAGALLTLPSLVVSVIIVDTFSTDIVSTVLLVVLAVAVPIFIFHLARRESVRELQYRSHAMAALREGLAILDANERFTYVNPAHAEVYGFKSPKDLIGETWRVLYAPAEIKYFEESVLPVLRTQGTVQVESIGTKVDGSKFVQDVSLTALPDGGLICVVRDLTRRKQAEDALAENRKFLRSVIDTNPNLIFVKDRHGRFTMVNQAVADMYGASVSDIEGKTDSDFSASPEEVAHFRKGDLRVIDGKEELFVAEEQITSAKKETRWLQTVKRPLTFDNDPEVYVLGVATDITDQKMLREQLFQAQKMEALGQLAGGVAHDFNNLLTGILGYVALLKMSHAEDPEATRIAQLIDITASRASELTQKLLGFARKGKHQNLCVDLHGLVSDTLSLLQRTIERNIVIREKLTPQKIWVQGDPLQIQQIVLNLAINARDAMTLGAGGSDGGELRITTRALEVTQPITGIGGTAKPGRYVALEVQDSGCGIPENIRQKIFEPFFTTKEQSRGTGMGLALVYGIVKNHGGVIEIDTAVGRGATFRIYLPAAQPPALAYPAHDEHPKFQGKGTILFVDDHNVVRDVTAKMLSSLGYTVVTACDGREALAQFSKLHGRVDLVILDSVLPGTSAKVCLKTFKESSPATKVLLSSGYGRTSTVDDALRQGADGFVMKPFQIDSLSQVVSEVLRPARGNAPIHH